MLDIGADIMPELFPCCGVSGVIVGSAPVKLHENRRHTTKRAAATGAPQGSVKITGSGYMLPVFLCSL